MCFSNHIVDGSPENIVVMYAQIRVARHCAIIQHYFRSRKPALISQDPSRKIVSPTTLFSHIFRYRPLIIQSDI